MSDHINVNTAKKPTQFRGVINGAALIMEQHVDPTKKPSLGFMVKEKDFLRRIAFQTTGNIQHVYEFFRKSGFGPIESETRTRTLLLKAIEAELNGIIFDDVIEKLLKPYERHIPTDPNYQTPEDKKELERRKETQEQAVS